ncbi:hypothetical protein FPV67DRAFT_1655192 [Lyophyllum atratum]|nr:hypothetical protein FPV67DRAFT_1655192 [Lyophyllum atratum]
MRIRDRARYHSTTMLLDIQNLLRADRPKREPMTKALPGPGQLKARKAATAIKDTERPPRKSNLRAMASELDNFSAENIPVGAFNAEVEQQLKTDAWMKAVRAAAVDPEFTFPPAPNRNRETNDNAHGLVVTESSDLSTLFGSECTDASTETIKVVQLFSLEEIYSKKNAFIPPLIINHDDIIGDRLLMPKHDGFMYQDVSVNPLDHIIGRRSLDVLPEAPSQALFRKHAVRVFFEVLPAPGIMNGPFYKYIGDYFVKRTEKYLPKRQWVTASQELKDLFVTRFVEANNKVDKYRTPRNLTKEYVHDLFARGNIFPLVLLQQAHQLPPEPFYEITPSPSAESLAGVSMDSASVYSQESLPRVEDECPFEIYASAAGVHVPPSPAPASRRDGGPLITYENGAQVIHLDCDHTRCYSEVEELSDEGHALESSVFEHGGDVIEGDDNTFAGDYGENHGLKDVFVNTFAGDYEENYGLKSVFEDDSDSDYYSEDDDDYTEADEDAFVGDRDDTYEVGSETIVYPSLPRAAEFVLELMQAQYHEVQQFAAYLQETAEAEVDTERARSRLELVRLLRAYSAPITPWEDSHLDRASEDEEGDAGSDITERAPAGRLSMVPWFEGFEPLPIIISDDSDVVDRV